MISGLPYTIVVCWICVALWRAVQVAAGDLDPFGPQFSIGIFDCWGAQPMKTLMDKKTEIFRLAGKFLINIVAAPWTLAVVHAKLDNSNSVWKYAIAPVFSFIMTIVLHIAEIGCNGCWAIAWFFYLCFVCYATAVRVQFRDRLGIMGNPFEDFFASLFLYPNVAVQLEETAACITFEKSSKIAPSSDIENTTALGSENPAFMK